MFHYVPGDDAPCHIISRHIFHLLPTRLCERNVPCATPKRTESEYEARFGSIESPRSDDFAVSVVHPGKTIRSAIGKLSLIQRNYVYRVLHENFFISETLIFYPGQKLREQLNVQAPQLLTNGDRRMFRDSANSLPPQSRDSMPRQSRKALPVPFQRQMCKYHKHNAPTIE